MDRLALGFSRSDVVNCQSSSTSNAYSVLIPNDQVDKVVSDSRLRVASDTSKLVDVRVVVLNFDLNTTSSPQREVYVLAPVTYTTPKYNTEIRGWYLLAAYTNDEHTTQSRDKNYRLNYFLSKIELDQAGDNSVRVTSPQNNTLLELTSNSKSTESSDYKNERSNFYIFSKSATGNILINYFYLRGGFSLNFNASEKIKLNDSSLAFNQSSENPSWTMTIKDAKLCWFPPDYITKKYLSN